MTRIQNKETFKSILLTLGMVVFLFLAGCRDKSIDHYNRGTALLKKGEYDQAILCFNKALEINPRHAIIAGLPTTIRENTTKSGRMSIRQRFWGPKSTQDFSSPFVKLQEEKDELSHGTLCLL